MHSYGIAGVEYGKKIYFSGFGDMSGLFEFNPMSGTVIQKSCFPGEIGGGFYHCEAFLYKNYAWYIPLEAENLVCVNLDTMEEMYFSIQNRGFTGQAFIDYIPYNDNKLILIPGGEPLTTLAIIDLERHDVECIPDVIPQGICIGAYLWGNSLSFINSRGSICAKLNLKNREKRFVDMVGVFAPKYNSLIQDGENVYLIPCRDDAIVVINISSEKKQFVQLLNSLDRFKGGFVLPDYVIIFPRDDTKRYLKISKKTNVIEWKAYPYNGCVYGWMELRHIMSNQMNNVVMSLDGNMLYFDDEGEIIDVKSYAAEVDNCINMTLASNQDKIVFLRGLNGGYLHESERIDLINLIQSVTD